MVATVDFGQDEEALFDFLDNGGKVQNLTPLQWARLVEKWAANYPIAFTTGLEPMERIVGVNSEAFLKTGIRKDELFLDLGKNYELPHSYVTSSPEVVQGKHLVFTRGRNLKLVSMVWNKRADQSYSLAPDGFDISLVTRAKLAEYLQDTRGLEVLYKMYRGLTDIQATLSLKMNFNSQRINALSTVRVRLGDDRK